MAYRGDSNEGGCIALFVAIGVFIAFILNLPSILTWFWKSINGSYGGVWIIVIVFGCIYIKELINETTKTETHKKQTNEPRKEPSFDGESVFHPEGEKAKTDIVDSVIGEENKNKTIGGHKETGKITGTHIGCSYQEFNKKYYDYFYKHHKVLDFYKRNINNTFLAGLVAFILIMIALTSALYSIILVISFFCSYEMKDLFLGKKEYDLIASVIIFIITFGILWITEHAMRKIDEISELTNIK